MCMTPDVVDFTAADAPERFTESLRTTGFAVVTNHPLSWELVQSLYAEWEEFFTSGAAEAYTVGPDNQEGYFPPKIAETAKGRTVRDLKEFFHVYPWSDKYPSEVSDDAMRYRDIATDVASTLLGWVDANIRRKSLKSCRVGRRHAHRKLPYPAADFAVSAARR